MNTSVRNPRFLPGTSQFRGNARTFALQMALDTEGRRIELGDRLRELRGARPQRLVADRLQVTERTYGKWERGEGGIQWEHLEECANFFGVSTNYLLFGQDEHEVDSRSQLDRIESMVSEIRDLLTTPASAARVAAAVAGRAVEAAESPPRKAAAQSRSPRRAQQRKIA